MTLLQNKTSVEKTKQALESEFNELHNELKALKQGKSESEHRRKKAETHVQELQIKYEDTERQKQEALEKTAKLQVGRQEEVHQSSEDDPVRISNHLALPLLVGAGQCEQPGD